MNAGVAGRAARYVLGVNAGPHDNSAALLRDGELVAMVEQERLSGNRRAIGESPADAISSCLAEEGIDLGAVAEIAVGWDVPRLAEIEGFEFNEDEFTSWLIGAANPFARPLPPLRFVDHHLAHAASAFYTSGLKEAAILIVDGRGESVSTTIATGHRDGIDVVDSWGTQLSLGHLYGCAAAWTGLTIWGAGKLMGLAAYGNAGQPVPLTASTDGYEIACAPPSDSPVSTHLKQLRIGLVNHFKAKNFPFSWGEPDEVMAHADFAASIQSALEEVLLSLARIARRESGHPNLVMAGGVALNCSANGALLRSGLFSDIWIPPFPHDAGVSLGAALVADRAIHPGPRPLARLAHAFWAPRTADADAETLAELSDCDLSRHDDAELADTVARHLAEGRLVAWHQGRAEVGQRALGARSILCNPRKRLTLVRANTVKGRESWRPLAPVVLAEHAGELFDGPLPSAADFMLTAWPVREEARPRLPAAVHVDGSARPQVVRPVQSRYHAVVHAFRERTGVPAVINTSFNLAGEPIVFSARDAVRAFMRSDLEVLVLGDIIVRRQVRERGLRPRAPEPPPANFFVPWAGMGRGQESK